METNNRAGLDESPLLAIGSKSYELTSTDNDCQASSSTWSPVGCHGGVASSSNEYWENEAWRNASGNLSHAQLMQGQHRAKRQHCWDDTTSIPSNVDVQGSGQRRIDFSYDGSSAHGIQTEPFGCFDTTCAGKPGLDLFQTGSMQGASSSTFPSHGLRSASAGCGVDAGPFFADAEWKNTRDLMAASVGQPMENLKGKVGEHLHGSGGHGMQSRITSGMTGFPDPLSPAVEGGGGKSEGIPGSFCDYSPSQVANLVDGDFRDTHKRKMSSVEVSNASSFDPQFTVTTENVATRTRGLEGNPLDLNRIGTLNSPPNQSVIQIWDDSDSDSTGFAAIDNEPRRRGANGRSSTLRRTQEDSIRSLQNQSVSAPQEPTHSHSHSLFARSLRRSSQSHTFTRRNPDSMGGTSSSLPGFELWLPVAAERSPAAPVLGNLGASRGSRRGISAFSSPGSRERRSPTRANFEGGRSRSMSGRTLDWALAAAAGANPPSDAMHRLENDVAASAGRENEMLDPIAQANHVEESFFHSATLAPYLSRSRSSASRADRNPPPAASQQPPSVPPLEAPPAFMGQQPGRYRFTPPSSSRARRETLLAGPVHNVLGLPFRGFHSLRADGDYRRQFLSEILNAMHNAFRNEDLNIEELVMLDPSILYGGVDAHDQHRDMRLDVDNMTYEELLALEERIGSVNMGLDDEKIALCLRDSKYSSLDATVAAISQESDVKCSICQEEFVEDDELGSLYCGHGYHSTCIKKWLSQKNECPICKASAYMKPS